jgi:hypothetical protein
MSDLEDEFFVGYLPTPARHRRWLRQIALAGVGVISMLAALVAAMQRDPGTGKWELDHLSTYEGILDTEPYPLLRSSAGTFLIVQQGKHGVAERLGKLAGQRLRLRGSLIARSSQKMIELADSDDAVETLGAAGEPATESPLGLMSLDGEIIDPKCFLGAMKPGDGKTHKACAALCLRGGVPPMFRSANGSLFLLADEAGRGITGGELDHLIAFVGDHVELRGYLAGRNDLMILRVDLSSIRRI